MTRPEVRLLQVTLTGARLAPCSDDELNARIQNRFKVSQAQSAAMLKGRCVVKRGVDDASAGKLIAVLKELGLEAIVEAMPPPLPAGASEPAAPNPLDALQALASQKLPKPRTSFSYVMGLLLVTLLCVALPALYISLTGGIAYGWFWYLTHIHEHLPRNGQLIALMYAVPGLAGAMLLVFLLRPLFASRPPPNEGLKLDVEKEAAFVSGVHALCRAIGVSPPIEIRLSWDANASVHFRTRWLSFFTGHKVLTIGMSLVGGLNARQFVGVLAHEFGHFAQRFGMICSFTVNSVNAWLEYRAYGEDSWDRKLHEWSDQASEKEGWFYGILSLSIGATWIATALIRRIMAGLFHVSFRMSRYMSRQMEFDADRYEALLAGSDMFRVTARSLRALNHAFSEVNGANIEAWQEQRLLGDLPEAVAAHAREYDAVRLAKIEQEMREETTTRYWDSHPPDAARIDNAEKQRLPGIYLEQAPAALLFWNFALWSQRATKQFYTEQGVEFTPEQLRPRHEILGDMAHRARQREQLNRFFNGQFQEWPMLQLEVPGESDVKELAWQDCIDQIRARSPEMARNWQQAFQSHEDRPLLRAAVKLSASSRQMGLPGAERSAQELGVELGDIAGRRMPFDKPLAQGFALYAQRIVHAIEAMSPAQREKATQLRDTLVAMAALERDASVLEELSGAMRIFGSIAENQGSMPGGFDVLEANFGDGASQFIVRADRIPQAVTAGGTVGAYLRTCCRHLPAAGATVGHAVFARASWPMPDAFHRLYLMALGELVGLCEATEKGSGIRPIRLVA